MADKDSIEATIEVTMSDKQMKLQIQSGYVTRTFDVTFGGLRGARKHLHNLVDTIVNTIHLSSDTPMIDDTDIPTVVNYSVSSIEVDEGPIDVWKD